MRVGTDVYHVRTGRIGRIAGNCSESFAPVKWAEDGRWSTTCVVPLAGLITLAEHCRQVTRVRKKSMDKSKTAFKARLSRDALLKLAAANGMSMDEVLRIRGVRGEGRKKKGVRRWVTD